MKWTTHSGGCDNCFRTFEQLIEFEGRERCESCWEAFAMRAGLCITCGVEPERSRDIKCNACIGDEIRDRLANTRNAGGVW